MADLAAKDLVSLALATQLHRAAVQPDAAAPHALLLRRSVEDPEQLRISTGYCDGSRAAAWTVDTRQGKLRPARGVGLVDAEEHDDEWESPAPEELEAVKGRIFRALVPKGVTGVAEAFGELRTSLAAIVSNGDRRKRFRDGAMLYRELTMPDDPDSEHGGCPFVGGLKAKFGSTQSLRALGDAEFVANLAATHPKHAVACLCTHTEGLDWAINVSQDNSATMIALDFVYFTTRYAPTYRSTHFWKGTHEALASFGCWPPTFNAFRKLRGRWLQQLTKRLLGRLTDNIAKHGWTCPFYCCTGASS